MTRPSTTWDRPTAVLFDLDGTLYDQRVLRKSMLRELARAPFTKGPFAALRIARTLRAFRLLREDLRSGQDKDAPLAELQFARPAKQLGIEPARVRGIVEEWMFEKPLPHMEPAAWPQLRETLVELKSAGLQLGVFSDYPPEAKLKALGVADLFEVALGATDARINAFKPHPQGFVVGAEALGASIETTVYVGDRHDVDGGGAAAAGMRCVILETGMAHVGAGPSSAPAASPATSAAASAPGAAEDDRRRSIQTFDEVPRAVGIA